jgi:hypothetical protein
VSSRARAAGPRGCGRRVHVRHSPDTKIARLIRPPSYCLTTSLFLHRPPGCRRGRRCLPDTRKGSFVARARTTSSRSGRMPGPRNGHAGTGAPPLPAVEGRLLPSNKSGRTFSIRRFRSKYTSPSVQPTGGRKMGRYRGDRGGGGRTSLHRPPDKSSSRIGLTSLCTFQDGVRRQGRWSQAWRQREGRTCLQNRWAGESSPAGSIPVRLRHRKRPLTSGVPPSWASGGRGKDLIRASGPRLPHKSSGVSLRPAPDKSFRPPSA